MWLTHLLVATKLFYTVMFLSLFYTNRLGASCKPRYEETVQQGHPPET